MRQKKRMMLLGVISLMAALLVAWKLKPVELIDDKLLIDLDITIQDADWGQESSGEDTDTPGTKDDDSVPVVVPTAAPEDLEEITILLRGERLKVNDVSMHSLDTVEKLLDKKCGDGTRVYLIDDYAEAHVYKSVLELLKRKQAQIPFVISEVMAEG